VISNDAAGLVGLQRLPITVVRGSTSMLPGRDASYDVAIAFHYLHEVDPFFHANVVTELGRVGKRLVVVEPEPPRDPLGTRIAALYSRAKRELGQFENYHHIDYWRKLLSIVKSDVRCETFTFMRTPPRFAMKETVALIIAMMAAEQTPESYLSELRALAARPDAVLVPQARFVIVGSAAGQTVNVTAGAPFRERVAAEARRTIASPFATPGNERLAPSVRADIAARPSRGTEPEAPALPGRPAVRTPAATGPVANKVVRNAFGLPLKGADAGPPLAPSVKGDEEVAFGLPAGPAEAAAEFGWEWETPRKTP